MIIEEKIEKNFYWFNEPEYSIKNEVLTLNSKPDTDFWQSTHYGFKRDNGHCLLTEVQKDFSMTVRTKFKPRKQYDQCGLMIRLDSENWIKISTEYESEHHSRLGSVVTNLGFSDWATIDVNSLPDEMWYRVQTRGNDFLIEYSPDGKYWRQMRIAHLHKLFNQISAGVYSCSPMDSSFSAQFDNFKISGSLWL